MLRFFFFYINVNLKLNKIQYSVPSIAEKDMTSSGSGYEHLLRLKNRKKVISVCLYMKVSNFIKLAITVYRMHIHYSRICKKAASPFCQNFNYFLLGLIICELPYAQLTFMLLKFMHFSFSIFQSSYSQQ